jgi:hypothetical protein
MFMKQLYESNRSATLEPRLSGSLLLPVFWAEEGSQVRANHTGFDTHTWHTRTPCAPGEASDWTARVCRGSPQVSASQAGSFASRVYGAQRLAGRLRRWGGLAAVALALLAGLLAAANVAAVGRAARQGSAAGRQGGAAARRGAMPLGRWVRGKAWLGGCVREGEESAAEAEDTV